MRSTIQQLKRKKVFFSKTLPTLPMIKKVYGVDLNTSMIICDQKLKSQMKNWVKSKNIYFVRAGESLKSFEKLPHHTKKILKKIERLPKQPSCFVGIGGGSVTDFTGFFSSIYRRGFPVFYIPSTLLSALDASHGGKTAINIFKVKNYFGTYHAPVGVLIVKDLIQNISKKELVSAIGELVKIAFIQGGVLYQKLKQKVPVSFENIWPLLPLGIEAKLRLVSRDPFDKKGIRKVLNLGHTLGHSIESYYNIPHGRAVAFGIDFAIRWSIKKKLISTYKAKQLLNILHHYTQLHFLLPIPLKQLEKLIQKDKKSTSLKKIDFIFVKNPGRCMVQSVWIKDLIAFYKKETLRIRK